MNEKRNIENFNSNGEIQRIFTKKISNNKCGLIFRKILSTHKSEEKMKVRKIVNAVNTYNNYCKFLDSEV